MIDFLKRIISKFIPYKQFKLTYINGQYSVRGWLLTKKEKEEILKHIKIKRSENLQTLIELSEAENLYEVTNAEHR